MKTWSLVFSIAAALIVSSSFAQSVEYDDMYFNSKDRKKLKEKEAAEQAAYNQSASARHKAKSEDAEIYADNDLSANYSARNQNPEFAARQNAQSATEEGDYFTSDYSYANSTYANASRVNSWNNNYRNWYNNAWVANNYWGSSIYGWNSPYYGSYYDTWGNPWMNPYYRSSWSTSFSFYMGSGWNYGYGNNWGWSMGFGYGNPYYNSWASWGPSYGWGGGWGGWYGGYPSVIIVNNDYGRNNYAYGKRGSQNGMVTRGQSLANGRVRPDNVNVPSGGSRPTYSGTTGGRVATNSNINTPTRATTTPSRGQVTRQDDYYNRNWRTSRQGDGYSGSGSYSQPSRSSQSNGWSNSSQSQWNNSRSSGGFDSGRSGSYNSGGGATRSSAPASSGSNGRTRGRD